MDEFDEQMSEQSQNELIHVHVYMFWEIPHCEIEITQFHETESKMSMSCAKHRDKKAIKRTRNAGGR